MRGNIIDMTHLSQVLLFEQCVSVTSASNFMRLFLHPQALISILKQKSDPENVTGCLRPFRIIMSLLDKPDIGKKENNSQRWISQTLTVLCCSNDGVSLQVRWS